MILLCKTGPGRSITKIYVLCYSTEREAYLTLKRALSALLKSATLVITSQKMESGQNQKKMAEVYDMEPPRNKHELETILGINNYLSKFAPRLSEFNAPLWHLLKELSEFLWAMQHDEAFRSIKQWITQEPQPVLTRLEAGSSSHFKLMLLNTYLVQPCFKRENQLGLR